MLLSLGGEYSIGRKGPHKKGKENGFKENRQSTYWGQLEVQRDSIPSEGVG